jgi:hypothetical protein
MTIPSSPIIIGELDGQVDPHLRVEWRMFFNELFVRSGGSTGAGAGVSSWNNRTGAVTMTIGDITATGGAPIASPAFSGNPTAPTPATTDSDTSLATTAFVHAAIAAIPAAGVTSWNTRTGAVVLTTADVTGAGGAPLASPTFTGTPTLPTGTIAVTQAAGNSTTAVATTAFVEAMNSIGWG